MIEPTPENINAFLHFGWLPRIDVTPPIPSDWLPTEVDSKKSVQEGIDIFRQAVIEAAGTDTHFVVPLSGGLDSRAVLAVLDELGHSTVTATLGVPNTYDYEVGRLIAKKTGKEHVAINVNDLDLSTENLVASARETGDWVNILEVHFNLHIAKLFPDTPIMSGFLGDFLAGSYARFQSDNWEQMKKQFAADAQTARGQHITDPNFSIESYLPDTPSVSQNSTLSPYEELVLTARHTCSMRPTTFTTNIDFRIPFRDEAWTKYILSAPLADRTQLGLYKEILTTGWPKFFDLPTKTYRGFPIKHNQTAYKAKVYYARLRRITNKIHPRLTELVFGIDPMINYTDFNNQFLRNQTYKDMAKENLADLEKRNLITWVDFQKLLTELDTKTYISPAHAGAILALVNLEINLKAGETPTLQ